MADKDIPNIAAIYLQVKQRERRDAKESWAKLAARARAAARKICDSPTLDAIHEFAELEIEWVAQRNAPWATMKWPEFHEAIKSGSYISKRSTINNSLSGHQPAEGWIYIMTSPLREGQIKIGYTTLNLRRRLTEFRNRYKDHSIELAYARWISNPSELEHTLHSKNSTFRIRGNATGESIEWFMLDSIQCMKQISKIINDNTNKYNKLPRSECFDPEGIKLTP